MHTLLNIKPTYPTLPIFGTLLFAALYFIATLYYPGGSQADKNAVGFSWMHNFWCNLLSEEAINGQINYAQPVAIVALLILCLTLGFFWWLFPQFTELSKRLQLMIQICGALSMLTAVFLFTNIDHNSVTNLSAFFGLIALTGTYVGLYKNGWKGLFYSGLPNIMLVIANAILYYNKELIIYLPLVQKITFVTFLSWICCIALKMFKTVKTANKRSGIFL